ncbi:MAG: hypothetical protein GX860_02860 [Alcaligenaceae bacterium]|jgi:ABC-type protease/lipase transport system fused ATPase/permease subunit|nr:hypothetical protein [Alcaligenaceae bacterium]
MSSLLSYPNILWLAVVMVVFLVVIHLVAMKMLSNHFRKKYPEAFGSDGKLRKAQENAAVVGTAGAMRMAAEDAEKAAQEQLAETQEALAAEEQKEIEKK